MNAIQSVSDHSHYTLNPCHPLDSHCNYWVAADGETTGLQATPSGESCIATVEDALHAAGYHRVYVIWPTLNRTDATFKRWSAKWSKRTSQSRDVFDASVSYA